MVIAMVVVVVMEVKLCFRRGEQATIQPESKLDV
jgi:hypothetical protein